MKRIIGGKAYNTETATLIWDWESDDAPVEAALYRNRHGAYFVAWHNHQWPSEGIRPLGANEAQEWLEEHCWNSQIIEGEFGGMPEAGSAEARLTVRIPDSLNRKIKQRASDANQSLNAWITRALEDAANADPDDGE